MSQLAPGGNVVGKGQAQAIAKAEGNQRKIQYSRNRGILHPK